MAGYSMTDPESIPLELQDHYLDRLQAEIDALFDNPLEAPTEELPDLIEYPVIPCFCKGSIILRPYDPRTGKWVKGTGKPLLLSPEEEYELKKQQWRNKRDYHKQYRLDHPEKFKNATREYMRRKRAGIPSRQYRKRNEVGEIIQ